MPPLVASSDADEGSDAPGINNHCTSRLSNSFKLCIVPAAVAAAAAAPTKPSRKIGGKHPVVCPVFLVLCVSLEGTNQSDEGVCGAKCSAGVRCRPSGSRILVLLVGPVVHLGRRLWWPVLRSVTVSVNRVNSDLRMSCKESSVSS